MSKVKVLLIFAACIALVAISWAATIFAKTDTQKQKELVDRAEAYIADEIYIKAEPLLAEAASYDTKYTSEIEEQLKTIYLKMIDKRSYDKKYIGLLNEQMSEKNPNPKVFSEAADYYFQRNKLTDGIASLREGFEKTKDPSLKEEYEKARYEFRVEGETYDDVKTCYGGAVQVMNDGLWGAAAANGNLVIPCIYNAISTYSNGQAVARSGNTLEGIDAEMNRTALYHGSAREFTNYACGRLGIKETKGYALADGALREKEDIFYQELGMFNDDRAPAKYEGKWGLIDTSGDWVIEPIYEEIICDEDLGYAFSKDRFFAKAGGKVYLFDGKGKQIGEDNYEDARPFYGSYAAVKKDGKWGFIDSNGFLGIECSFDDAKSFGQHLAAVKTGRYWGYISTAGKTAIEPVFLDAKSFSGGSAAVQTVDGWQFITLYEYM